MKKIATLVLFLIGTQVYSNAQTAEEIIKTYIENIGGEEALRRIKSVKMFAKVNAQGMSLPLEMINMADGRTITKFEYVQIQSTSKEEIPTRRTTNFEYV